MVLSNNDGCVIARSNEAKALGIVMGDPWHLRIPIQAGHAFRDEAGRPSDLMSDGIPR